MESGSLAWHLMQEGKDVVIAQVQEQLNQAVKKATGDAQKAMGDLQKSLTK